MRTKKIIAFICAIAVTGSGMTGWNSTGYFDVKAETENDETEITGYAEDETEDTDTKYNQGLNYTDYTEYEPEVGFKEYKCSIYENLMYVVKSNGEISIVGAEINAKELIVPEEIDGHKVTVIENMAFEGCDYVEKIEFPDSIKRIGRNNFDSKLLEIENVNGLWYYNNWLIGSDGYRNYETGEQTELVKQKKIEIREGTVGIADYGFGYFYELEEIVIPESLLYIGEYAFGYFIIPENGDASYDYALRKVEIKGNNLKTIGDGAFCGHFNLQEINLPDSLEYIGAFTFSHSKLKKIKASKSDRFPEKIKDAGYYPLWSANSGVVEIPETLESVYMNYRYMIADNLYHRDSYYYNYNIMMNINGMNPALGVTECVIIHPETKVDERMLYYLSEEEKKNQYKEIFFLGDESELQVIEIRKKHREDIYCRELPDNAEKVKINYNCQIIREGSAGYVICNGEAYLYECDDKVTEFDIPLSVENYPVTRILPGAFSYCSEIKELVIPENITLIGNNAFDYCSSLEKITFSKNNIIPSDAESILNFDSRGYNWLEFQQINGVENLFDGCESLKEIIIDENNDDYFSFEGCIYSKEPQKLLFCPETCEKLDILPNTTEIAAFACEDCNITEFSGIPATVKKIGEAAFIRCKFQEVIIPDSVTEIGQYAFAGNPELRTLKLSGGLKGISNNLFGGCTGMEYVEIPESVKSIGSEAFYNTSLKEIIIPPSVIEIAENAFQCPGNPEYTSRTVKIYGESGSVAEKFAKEGRYDRIYRIPFIDISKSEPARAKYIIKNNDEYEYFIKEDGTLEICGSLGSLNEIDIPSVIDGMPVTSVSACAFTACSEAVKATVPESITRIGDGAFDIDSLKDIIYAGTRKQWSKIEFGDHSLNNHVRLTCSDFEIKFGSGIISGDWTYYIDYNVASASVKCNNTEAENVKVPSEIDGFKVVKLQKDAFRGFKNLKTAELPETVTEIGDNAFYECSLLEKITLPKKLSSIGEYVFSSCSSLKKISLPEGITSISSSAFEGCSSLTEISLPEGLISIPYSAFDGCSSLTEISLPESITFIDSAAFARCSSLKKIILPEGVSSISSYAFVDCSSLAEISLPEGITEISFSAFNGCSGLAEISLPEGITSISSSAFKGCSSLPEISLPESITEISDSAFENCNSLKKISLPENITSISFRAFKGCSSLTGISLPEGITSISSSVFEGCSSLTEICLPESLKSIEYSAFEGCSSLTEISLPESITEIYSSAFENCNGLEKISLPKGIIYIFDSAFKGCTNLAHIEIPAGVSYLSDNALGYYYDEETGENKKYSPFSISGYTGTQAEKYAQENEIEFISLDNTPEVTEPNGDLDGDGDVTASDMLVMKNRLLNSDDADNTGITVQMFDMNGDGQINVFDMIRLKRLLFIK